MCVCVHAGGNLYILLNLRELISFAAYALRLNFIYQLKQRNFFITVGDDEDFAPLIRLAPVIIKGHAWLGSALKGHIWLG